MEHKYCQRVHFKRRLSERYDLTINSQEYKNLLSIVKNYKQISVLWNYNTDSLYSVDFLNKKLYFVFDHKTEEIKTVLTYEMAILSTKLYLERKFVNLNKLIKDELPEKRLDNDDFI